MNLQEQNSVINAITEQGGLRPDSVVEVPIDISVKDRPKKKKASKGSSMGKSSAPGTANAAASKAPGSDVMGAPRPGTGDNVVNAPAAGRGQQIGDAAPGLLGNVPGNAGGQLADGLDDAWLRQQQLQQQWLWSQMFQPYGNFVPNARFGEDLALPVWAEGQEQLNARQVHQISDDEEESLELAAPVGEQPAQGKIETLVQGQLSLVKESDKVTKPVQEDIANLIERYLIDATLPSEMEKLAKSYPRVDNVPHMKVPKLDAEVFQVADQNMKNTDHSLQAIQKGILGGMAAFAPVVELAFKRKDSDAELDELGDNLLDGLKLLAFANNAMLTRRREVLKPHLAATYAKAMTKGQETSTDWLYGGDLVETTKQCEASRRIGEKVLKRNLAQQQQKARGANQKKFRPNFPATMAQGYPLVRAFNPFQGPQFRFPTPQNYPGFQQFPQPAMQYGGFPRRQRYPRAQQPRQGFAKRGTYQK